VNDFQSFKGEISDLGDAMDDQEMNALEGLKNPSKRWLMSGLTLLVKNSRLLLV
jgi:hypothetical protein